MICGITYNTKEIQQYQRNIQRTTLARKNIMMSHKYLMHVVCMAMHKGETVNVMKDDKYCPDSQYGK